MNGTIKKLFIILFAAALIYIGYGVSILSHRIEKIEDKLGGLDRISCNERDTVKDVRRSVVRIVGGEGEGSGFAIQKGGFILTNFHVVSSEPNPKVVFPDNTFETGEVIMADKEADLAVVKVDRDIPVLKFSRLDQLGCAEEVLAIGYPLGGSLPGGSFVIRGDFSRVAEDKEDNVTYVMTDMTLIGGMSGGPLVNICGEVVGINTQGLSLGGMGLAVSSDSIIDKYRQMSFSKEPLKDVKKTVFQPNKNALEAVRSFYNYLKARKLEKAFGLLSDRFIGRISFQKWTEGYREMLDTTVRVIRPDRKVANRIHIKLSSKDLVGDGIVYKYFEGYWDVRKINGKWLLYSPAIKEIEDPDEYWFLDEYRLKEITEFVKAKGETEECMREMYRLSQEPGNESLILQELYALYNKSKKAKK